ncbi:hypothetical protein M2105_001579 [Paenibacillus sp. PastF-1]|uniref:hypothetical protein n=1 Tax=Paenibacillus sp. PastM-3 TaxID=2940534 RepID=UPI002476912F|nr:hypothetical protein [Paenibacillus sp. PastM-3]MDF9840580.1 hypothetical protein [Paenibacillus sp. PastF-2]MDF9847162.1 hypothetical protein [Paenibacillus sp. PastM-2]MDF9853734.1 hypothetical protein [Paenibacillus sp. PastF-1]MDH6478780.1 hypothetical protein [Paenibacillus sp. PastH-2]MDH6506512.1 hypothetical protein [Paenibacillus sp. PastM-3]
MRLLLPVTSLLLLLVLTGCAENNSPSAEQGEANAVSNTPAAPQSSSLPNATTGSDTSTAPNAPDSSTTSHTSVTGQMPETMPADFAFSVRFGITGKNEINTFNGTVTKDLVVKGTAQAELVLTDSEMADIYARLRTINIYRELKLEPDMKNCAKTPFGEEHWQIRLDGEERSFYWDEENCEITADAEQLKELRSYIFELVKSKPAYLELPEAVGGYD